MQNIDDARHKTIFLREVVIFALALIISSLQSSYLGWTHLLLPLITFFFVYKYNKQVGTKIIIFGIGIAFIISSIINGIGNSVIFTLVMIPPGYYLAISAKDNLSVAKSAANALIAMTAGWFLLWLVVSTGETQPYSDLINSLLLTMEQSVQLYNTDQTIDQETLYALEQTFQIMKELLPKVMPGILASGMIVTVWFTMAIGNRLIYKTLGNKPWGEFANWNLPDKLVWAAIAAGILYILPVDNWNFIGLNLIISLVVIYLFQGLSILVYWLDKWSLPIILKSAIYAIVFLQSFGIIILAGIGISDIWFNYRKLEIDKKN